MYGIFTYIYHKNQPNVDPCTVNIPYMDGVGEVVVESLEFFRVESLGVFQQCTEPQTAPHFDFLKNPIYFAGCLSTVQRLDCF